MEVFTFNTDIIVTICTLAAMIVVLLATRIKAEYVFGSALIGLTLSGVIGPNHIWEQAKNPALSILVMLIMASTIAGHDPIITKLLKHVLGYKRPKNMVGMGLLASILSSLMNNTAVVALLMHQVKSYAANSEDKRYSIYLSYFAILGGTLTLIGTSTHLVVDGILLENGLNGFHFFTPLPVGLLILIGALLYVKFSIPKGPALTASTEGFLFDDTFEQTRSVAELKVAGIRIKGKWAEQLKESPLVLLAGSLLVCFFFGWGIVWGLVVFVILSLFKKTVRFKEVIKAFPIGMSVILVTGLSISEVFMKWALEQPHPDISHRLLMPYVLYVCLFLLTLLLTEIITNNATAALMVPIALSIAGIYSLNPMTYVMAVCFAASASFLSPYGYQTNLMVANLNGYEMKDFVQVGFPFTILYAIIALISIPIFFPF